jgi:hypothetical protein
VESSESEGKLPSSETFDENYYQPKKKMSEFITNENQISSSFNIPKELQYQTENRLRQDHKNDLKQNVKFIQSKGLTQDYANRMLELYGREVVGPSSSRGDDYGSAVFQRTQGLKNHFLSKKGVDYSKLYKGRWGELKTTDRPLRREVAWENNLEDNILGQKGFDIGEPRNFRMVLKQKSRVLDLMLHRDLYV